MLGAEAAFSETPASDQVFPGCDNGGGPEIVEGTRFGCSPQTTSCGKFPVSSILSLGNDSAVGNQFNYWLTEDGKVGPGQFFLLNLGCTKKAVGVQLKNTHNRHFRDRGTKRFKLLGATATARPWKKAFGG